MHVVLVGPPGAGKGTQAVMVAKELGVPHISTGDIFRQALKEGTPLGKKAKEYMDSGALVPDDIVVGIVKERLAMDDCRKGFILDGFPRTIPQAEALDYTLPELGMKLDRVVNLAVPDEKLVLRLTGRRVCRSCGANYHVIFNPPKKEGICDNCGGELYQRDDDREETVRNRLKVYYNQTQPLIDYYARRGIIVDVNGDQEMQQVLSDVIAAIRG